MSSSKSHKKLEIDESLYSRQLYVLGVDAMKKMSSSNVLVVGLKGLGCEIAKNIILAGVKSVTLYDPEKDDIGKSRAEVSAPRLAELNQYLTPEVISAFKCVVATDISQQKKLELSEVAHKSGSCFISTEVRGLFGYTFNDFGDKFIVDDPTGEDPLSGMVANIEQSPEGIVTCLDETRHGLEDGQLVTFIEVQGMTELNACEPRKVKVLGPYTFSIGDTTSLSPYRRGGLFQQVKTPISLSFAPFAQALENPEFLISDFAKFDRPAQLHVGFQALHAFSSAHDGKYPRPGNNEDAAEVLRLANEINDKWSQKTELDAELLKKLSYQAAGDISPMVAVFGGLVAQEVLKACTGKFTPIRNFLYFDALECLPIGFEPSEEDLAPTGSRYDGQIAVFGRKFQQQIANYREFLVGSGAIGCEMLKNWAMMGIASGPNGVIHITDMDTIEKSNLNRQFLFRPSDVGKLKSDTAAAAVVKMNPDLQGKIDRVGAETECIYNDGFFEGIDAVTNALDNVDARRYMDSRCPLLESGTLGTKGNTQEVHPHVHSEELPQCIEHTIQWARDLFAGFFVQPAENVNAYLSTPDYVNTSMGQTNENVKIETLTTIRDYLVTDRPLTFEDCIVWARKNFENIYNNAIQQLLSGQLFWSPPKRAPAAIAFDPSSDLHVDFIVAAANLHAFNYGLKGSRDREHIRDAATASGVKIQVNENDNAAESGNNGTDPSQLEALEASLPNPASYAGVRLIPAEFEKDDDTNFHIDFITAASNLRASNYGITAADRFRTKQIAGKIIPAIATTTSLVTGLICLELYKIIGSGLGDNKRKIDDYKNGFINLALPFFGFSEPIEPAKYKYNGIEASEWDAIMIDRDVTLQELIDYFTNEHKLELSMVSSGVTLLYSPFLNRAKSEARKSMKISQLLPEVTKKDIEPYVKWVALSVCCCDADDEDVDVPDVRIKIRN
ncbi:hypothetical protein BX661DRAFT_182968 [Kickxella alabastrina]|uniref:uncharacterized protein n=1 Tax=Kickxella alabastrina TaxID=61397 RepID=UPI00221E9EEE|nr:uncharacterized protein BX661DRAFT_182968 [Kickxella alabastrina]KAI7827274.1 hypothetical protein BX661DRAFT_182968 [Kickxella alabastrina]